MAIRIAIGLLTFAALLGGARPDTARADGTENDTRLVSIDRFELDNGMTFLSVDRPGSATVAAGWVVGSGSAADPAGRAGVAHMLEHLLFKGSAKLEPGELDIAYAKAGATGLNAVTQHDLTAYFVSLPTEKLELWFWLESDRLLAPALQGFQNEKEVVREERMLRIESTPTGLLEELLSTRLWGSHPYGRPVSGGHTDLDAIERADAKKQFDSIYVPRNLTAVLVGDLEPDAVRELAQRYFGRLSLTTPPQKPIFEDSLPASDPLRANCDCRTQARALYRSPAFGDPDTAALEVLGAVLNGRSGRLHRNLVLKQDLAFAAFASQRPLRSGGHFALTAEAKGETTADELLAALDSEISQLIAEPVSEEELAKARTRLRADGLRSLRDSSQLMMQILLQAGTGDGEHLNWWFDAIDLVTAVDVQRVAGSVLGTDERAVGLFQRTAPGATP